MATTRGRPLEMKKARVHRAFFTALESGRRDLNPRRPPWQGGTLPLSYSREFAGLDLSDPALIVKAGAEDLDVDASGIVHQRRVALAGRQRQARHVGQR